jgi:hypothetical protein
MNQALVQDVVAEVMRRLGDQKSAGRTARPSIRAGEDAPANEGKFREAHSVTEPIGQYGIFSSVDAECLRLGRDGIARDEDRPPRS